MKGRDAACGLAELGRVHRLKRDRLEGVVGEWPSWFDAEPALPPTLLGSAES